MSILSELAEQIINADDLSFLVYSNELKIIEIFCKCPFKILHQSTSIDIKFPTNSSNGSHGGSSSSSSFNTSKNCSNSLILTQLCHVIVFLAEKSSLAAEFEDSLLLQLSDLSRAALLTVVPPGHASNEVSKGRARDDLFHYLVPYLSSPSSSVSVQVYHHVITVVVPILLSALVLPGNVHTHK